MVSTVTVDTFLDDGADMLDQLPKVVEKVDFVGLESGMESEAEANVVVEEAAAELEAVAPRKLYFVRVPRPPLDNSSDQLKKLNDTFQAHVTKIKALNAKVQVKREEVRELRKQMQAARSLKGESQPEYEEKLAKLKQMQELRNTYQKKMGEIREALKGLDCKSEDELDAKMKELEGRISHEHMELRDEKVLVKQIATLRSQRDAIKLYDTQKASMVEMEEECSRIKAVINDMDGDFSILKGERDSAQKIISELYAKLQVADLAMKAEEELQADAVAKKNDALEKLDKARDAANSGMKPYRENRKFSLQVRDMVAAGQVEEAFALCEAQVDEMMTLLDGDKAYRTNYGKLWADQRKTPVAEILPESCLNAVASASRVTKASEAPRAVANGAEKAKALIADLLQQASKEVAVRKEEQLRARAAEPAPRYHEEEADADDEGGDRVLTPGEIVTAAAEAALKRNAKKSREAVTFVTNPAAKAAEVFGSKIEVPDVVSPEFVLPVTAAAEQEKDLATKEQVREEQRLKAKEAEERKLRKIEQAEEKKVKAAERAKQAEADAKAAAVAAKVAAEKKAAAEKSAMAAVAAFKAAAAAEAEASGIVSKPEIKNIYAKTTTVATAKRPAKKGVAWQLKKFMEQRQNMMFALGISLIIIIILFLVSYL